MPLFLPNSPPLLGADGWTDSTSETWTYASGDGTNVGTFTIASVDLTGKYQAGDRVKFTQSSTVKYGIITKVAFSTNTTVTIYMGTDYTIANATISANFYSKMKSPQGFPLSPSKWTITTTDSSDHDPGVSASFNTCGVTIAVPIGAWQLRLSLHMVVDTGSTSARDGYMTLSSDASTETHPRTTVAQRKDGEGTSDSSSHTATTTSTSDVLLTSATTFTLMGKLSSTSGVNVFRLAGSAIDTNYIEAVSTYL